MLVLLCLALAATGGSAQIKQGDARLDSLLAEVSKAGEDTNAVKLLDNVSFAYSYSDPEQGLRYAQRSLTLARKLGWQKGEAAAFNDLGNNYRHKAAYPQALDCFMSALRIHEELGDEKSIGTVSGNIGAVYYSQKNYEKAFDYLLISLNKARQTDDKRGELLAAGNIGTIYYDQGKYPQALEYMHRALRIAEALDDRRGMLNQLGNIGNVYASKGDLPAAMEWYLKALRIAEKESDRQVIAASLGNIGETYLDMAKDTALDPADRMVRLDNAIRYLEQGIAKAQEVAFNQAIIDFSQALSDAYAQHGDFKAALITYRKYTALKDSIFSLENKEKIAGLETTRQLELKDKDIQIASLAVAKKRNERYAFIAGIALLLALMGILARSFRRQQHANTLLAREKRRSDKLLLNILPAEVAEELKDSGRSAARHYEYVSVLFTDFVAFTGAAEQMSPENLVQELNEYFTAFDAIIERAGLEKIKTIGDAYMAVCGLPLPQPDHAQRAVQAGLDILAFMAERTQSRSAFNIRIGISSGPVVAGIIGVKKFAYDVWGDTVNTAARMEQHGLAGAINISHSTYELVKETYPCKYRGRIEAKHKGAVEMYLVDAAAMPIASL